MELSASDSTKFSLTLGDCAEQLITKFLQSINSYKSAVLQDTDPEPLHKMRVGMRRLRTALNILAPVVCLPPACSSKAIGKLAKVLGALRDLDIMQETLKEISLQEIPLKERQILAEVAEVAMERRHIAFVKMKAALAQDYPTFVKATRRWLKKPKYQNPAIAQQLATEILPDLLLPNIATFFLHDGWFVSGEEIDVRDAVLHDLRKQTKHIRYQLEYFLPFMSKDSAPFVPLLENTQELLGQMQDGIVLREFLLETVGKKNWKKLVVVRALAIEKKRQAWEDWQPAKQQLYSLDWRRSLRMACL